MVETCVGFLNFFDLIAAGFVCMTVVFSIEIIYDGKKSPSPQPSPLERFSEIREKHKGEGGEKDD